MAMDGVPLGVFHITEIIHWLANNIHHPAQGTFAYWHRNRPTCVDDFHSAHHAVGGHHRDRAHTAFTKMLLHFRNHIDGRRHVETLGYDPKCLIDGREIFLFKLHIDYRTNNLHNAARMAVCAWFLAGHSHTIFALLFSKPLKAETLVG